MIKKDITYTDMDGNEITEAFYFHLFSPEIVRIEASYGLDIKEYVKRLQVDGDLKGMVDFFEKIVLTAYGKRTNAGKSFVKDPAITKEFEYSQAYAELFEELLTDNSAAQNFANGLFTKKANSGGVTAQPTNDPIQFPQQDN